MISILAKSSSDKSIKYVLGNKTGNKFEAVYFKFFEEEDKNRPYFNYYLEDGQLPTYTICISSQIGCAMGCTFCATGYGGFFKNISAEELLEQVFLIRNDLIKEKIEKVESLGNIILMGMGEPLMNLPNVLKFCRKLNTISTNFIKLKSISTIGIVPKIKELAHVLDINIKLFLSLHSPFDEERSSLMPINLKYNIQEIIAACEYFAHIQQQKIIVCYLLLKGINDSEKHAQAFSELLNPQFFETQILSYNPIPNVDFERPSIKTAFSFAQIIKEKGLTTDIRISKGQDIQGGCGQLVQEDTGKTIKKRDIVKCALPLSLP
ncbi:MAG: 23S rRNA (adenine(2503)-C(2))-methyltransferase RlmN [Chlamydiales bacterium]|jgi:23S rRNA (adenine2503-C2)-methyltransferase|nr:23S rRNA (adenine(2503)-C(2))-methyltransferase RlmN [Chlamydiales bacterium]